MSDYITSAGAEETEAATVARIAREAGANTILEDGPGWLTVPVPPGWRVETIDVSRHQPTPARPAGFVYVYDADSFVRAIAQRALDRPAVAYADEEQTRLVAVLDDDRGTDPGWRQYRVELSLRPTPEWRAWKQNSDKLMAQGDFAIFIEEHAREFRQPSAADMLELASTIEGTQLASFKAGVRLKDGSRQVGWNESIEARAGQSGQLTIPDRFLIVVRPFIGAAPFEVEAWLRFRIVDGHLKLAYKLDRPDLTEKQIFNDVLERVTLLDGDLPILRGPAPVEA